MRQRDVTNAGEILRLVPFQPEQFGRGEAGQHVVAHERDQPRRAAERLLEFGAFGAGRRVAPELRRADNFVFFVEHDKAVLLAGDAHAGNLFALRAQVPRNGGNALVERRDPISRMLLHVARRQSPDQVIGHLRLRDDFPRIGVERDDLRALRPTVDAEKDHINLGVVNAEWES